MENQAQVVKHEFDLYSDPDQGQRSKFDPTFLSDFWNALGMKHQAQIVRPEFDPPFDPRSRSKVKI